MGKEGGGDDHWLAQARVEGTQPFLFTEHMAPGTGRNCRYLGHLQRPKPHQLLSPLPPHLVIKAAWLFPQVSGDPEILQALGLAQRLQWCLHI